MSKPNLEQWALIAEVIGGLAVVVTLGFLVHETRANTDALRASTYLALTAELNQSRRDVSDAEMAALGLKVAKEGFGSISEVDRYRLMMRNEAKWGIYEAAFYARQRGVLGDEEWERFENAICRNYGIDREMWLPGKGGAPGVIAGVGSTLATNVTPLFREYVERTCTE